LVRFMRHLICSMSHSMSSIELRWDYTHQRRAWTLTSIKM
jgi:hypothetical protein